jgi:hypothetical protein
MGGADLVSSRRVPRTIYSTASLASLLLAALASPARGEGRSVALLEYRAGVRAAPEIAEGMADELGRLTSHKVVTPAEARRRLGASIDAEVARCKGTASCIAQIGERLQCEDVILVGVSQLGDLILAIQRIEVSSGRVLNRLADSLNPKRRIRPAELQSYLRRLLPPSDFKRYGRVVVKTDAAGDEVFLDETSRGKTPLAPIVVPAPGRYALRVTRPGHEDFVARLDVLPEASVEVTPKLAQRALPPRWYQQWWVWTLVGGVVAAGVTGAAIGATRGQDRIPAVVKLPR